MEKRFCRKCLTKDMDDGEYYRTVQEYISNLPEEIKISSDFYEKRLHYCQNCDNMVNGMCRLCGCFVEVRAAKKMSHCALNPALW